MGSHTLGLGCTWAKDIQRRRNNNGKAPPWVWRVPGVLLHRDMLSPACTVSAHQPTVPAALGPASPPPGSPPGHPWLVHPPLNPLGAEWMWPWAAGRRPLSVRLSLSGSGEDWLLSVQQMPGGVMGQRGRRRPWSSGSPPPPAWVGEAPSSMPVVQIRSGAWQLARAPTCMGTPRVGTQCLAVQRPFLLPLGPVSGLSSAASGSLDLEQGGERRWDAAGGGHTVRGVVPAWRLT